MCQNFRLVSIYPEENLENPLAQFLPTIHEERTFYLQIAQWHFYPTELIREY